MSQSAAYAPAAKNNRHPLTGKYHPEGFGAKGDWDGATGTNDQAAFEAAIAAAKADGGGEIYCSRAYLVTGLVLPAGVSLCGPTSHRPRYINTPPPAQLVCNTPGAIVVDTEPVPTGNTRPTGIGVSDLYINGLGVASKGIRFHKTWWSTIRGVTVRDTQDQGIEIQAGTRGDGTPFNVGATLEDILAVNCVINKTRTAPIAAVEINGGDPTGDWIEATTSLTTAVVDSNLYVTGILIGSANGFFQRLIGELSEVGILVTGSYNKFSICRADLNPGHGWVVTGDLNTFASCTQIDNGQATASPGVYSGAKVSGKGNSFAAFKGRGNKVKYHIEDLATGAALTARNNYDVGCTGEFATANYSGVAYNGTGRTMPPHDIHPAANSTTLDVSGTSVIVLDLYSAATTITALTGGVNGQTVTLHATAAVPITLAHSGAFRQRVQSNRVLLPGEQATYRMMNNQWWEVDPGPTIRAVNLTTVDVALDLQTELVWCNNPADRTLTLPKASDVPNRRRTIKSINTGVVNLAVPSGGGTLPATSVAAGASLELISNGTNWYAI